MQTAAKPSYVPIISINRTDGGELMTFLSFSALATYGKLYIN